MLKTLAQARRPWAARQCVLVQALAAVSCTLAATAASAQPEIVDTELVSLSDQAVVAVTLSDDAEPAARVSFDGETAAFRLDGVTAAAGLEKSGNGLARRLDLETDGGAPTITVRLDQSAHLSYTLRPGVFEVSFCLQPDAQRQCPTGDTVRTAARRLADAEAASRRAEEQRAEQQRLAQEQAEADRKAELQRQADQRRLDEEQRRRAADRDRRMITTDRVHLRSGPGTSYRSLGLLQSSVRVIPGAQQGEWTKVQSYLGTGWVASEFLQPTEILGSASVDDVGATGTTTTAVSLRTAPSVESERLAVLSAGREVRVLRATDLWLQVEVSGSVGWIFAEYVER